MSLFRNGLRGRQQLKWLSISTTRVVIWDLVLDSCRSYDICLRRRLNTSSALNVDGLNHNDQSYHRLPCPDPDPDMRPASLRSGCGSSEGTRGQASVPMSIKFQAWSETKRRNNETVDGLIRLTDSNAMFLVGYKWSSARPYAEQYLSINITYHYTGHTNLANHSSHDNISSSSI
jgi:hypothetical protein